MITACNPWLPTSAAAALTLTSLPSVELDNQADRLPDSKLSAKIWSEVIGGIIGVRVAVAIEALVAVAGTIGVRVAVDSEPLVAVAGTIGVFVAVAANVAGIEVGVRVSVGVANGADVEVPVAVGFGPPPAPTQLALPVSVKVCPAIGTNCQS